MRNTTVLRKRIKIALAAAAAALLAAYLGCTMLSAHADKTLFLLAKTSDGHHQFEQKCELCHLPFKGASDAGCHKCHDQELKAAKDSHPEKVFKDPRNAQDLKKINALSCRTCHKEHLEDRYSGGVTVAPDFCIFCHQEVTKKRPTHKDMDFAGCRECHNYHDNSALYEDFLEKHLEEPDTFDNPVLTKRNFFEFYKKKAGQDKPVLPLTLEDADAPPAAARTPAALEWAGSSHAQAGVNCRHCHSRDKIAWQERLDQSWCSRCHEEEVHGFLAGKHGLRLGLELPPVTVSQARRVMLKESGGKSVTCFSCHPAHRFDTAKAAVDACLTCHADRHSLAYKDSVHFRLWQEEGKGLRPEGAGVSCASCHLPRSGGRKKKKGKKEEQIRVEHNQNANLQPNQKMIRGVCQSCHGLRLILDSLADEGSVQRNFSGPRKHIKSLEMVKQRQQQPELKKKETE